MAIYQLLRVRRTIFCVFRCPVFSVVFQQSSKIISIVITDTITGLVPMEHRPKETVGVLLAWKTTGFDVEWF
jgi:hypothetical protein